MSQEMVKINVDGKEVAVPKGMLLVEAAKVADVEIPIFCYHPKLDPAGVCRMCMVEVEGQRKPVTACTMPVSDGMVVKTDSPLVEQLQRGVIEFLLLNHPLDCPVCDKGGECPLQDNTFRWGDASSRSLDPKFRRRKAVNLGQFTVLDEERCILCRRCTRFDDEIAQEDNLIIAERAHNNVVTTAESVSYDSYFSGNTIELCPVGALTSDVYRFKARPWDLSRVPAVCTGCSVGCNVFLDFRHGQLLRVVSRENPDIDDGWLCDRGRYNFQYIHADERITSPMIKKDGAFVAVTWEEALAEISLQLRRIQRDHGGDAIGAIGGGRLTNEEAYLLQKMARTALGSPHVDWRSGEQHVASNGEFPGKISDISRADGILLVDVLPAERSPVIDLRIRRAAERGGAVLAAAGPVMPSYRPECREFPALIQELPALLHDDALLDLYKEKERIVVLWSGRDRQVGAALTALMTRLKEQGAEVHLLIPGEQANARGAEQFGVHPEMLPGYRSVADEGARSDLEDAWRVALPTTAGADTDRMLHMAGTGGLQALYLAGSNVLNTFPDRALAASALDNVPLLIVQDLFMTETAEHADIVLPAAAFPEKSGTYTACDGTPQKVEQAMGPSGQVKSDGDIFAAVASALGVKLYESEQELQWEIQHLAGTADASARRGAPVSMMGLTDPGAEAPEQRLGEGDRGSELHLVPVEKLYSGGGTAWFDQELRRARPKAEAALHPEDAERLGVHAGQVIRLSASEAAVQYTVVVDAKVLPGSVQVPKGLFEAPSNALGSGSRRVAIHKQLAQEVG